MYRNIDDEIREEYLNWLLTPPGEREPSTKTAFAEEHEISRSTLKYWEASEEFKEKLRSIKVEWGSRWHGDILGRLYQIVMDGSPTQSVQASKVLLQHLTVGEPDAQSEQLTNETIEAIKQALEDAGFKTI